jgi:ribosomal protein L11 methyltransferase
VPGAWLVLGAWCEGGNPLPGAPALTLRFPHDEHLIRDLVAAQIDGTLATAIEESDDREWRVFYPSPASRDEAAGALELYCRPHGIAVSRIDVDDEDWARRSQAALTSVPIGDIIVSPPWDVPAPGARHPAPLVIVIEPSVGFGTGHHASTRLCLLAMQQLDLRGTSVIDVGTGSGVLAIAAAKLGAASVVAIDTDADAIANARDNAARNDAGVFFFVADASEPGRSYLRGGHGASTFDVVLANLTAAWLRRLSVSLMTMVADGGTLVLSGIQTSEKDRVLEAFVRFRPPDRAPKLAHELDEDGWSALVLTALRP